MEKLIKKVEDLRMHIRNRNILSGIISILLIANSLMVVFNGSYHRGARLFSVYLFFLVLFLVYYIYKNRSNLPFPKEITKESMEDYQIKQLKRYLYSCHSLFWWGFLPLAAVFISFFSTQWAFYSLEIVKSIGVLALMVILYFTNKRAIKKYTKQYVELTGKDIEVWFSL